MKKPPKIIEYSGWDNHPLNRIIFISVELFIKTNIYILYTVFINTSL